MNVRTGTFCGDVIAHLAFFYTFGSLFFIIIDICCLYVYVLFCLVVFVIFVRFLFFFVFCIAGLNTKYVRCWKI